MIVDVLSCFHGTGCYRWDYSFCNLTVNKSASHFVPSGNIYIETRPIDLMNDYYCMEQP